MSFKTKNAETVRGPVLSLQAARETANKTKAFKRGRRMRTPSEGEMVRTFIRHMPNHTFLRVGVGLLLPALRAGGSAASAGNKTTLRIWAMGRDGGVRCN